MRSTGLSFQTASREPALRPDSLEAVEERLRRNPVLSGLLGEGLQGQRPSQQTSASSNTPAGGPVAVPLNRSKSMITATMEAERVRIQNSKPVPAPPMTLQSQIAELSRKRPREVSPSPQPTGTHLAAGLKAVPRAPTESGVGKATLPTPSPAPIAPSLRQPINHTPTSSGLGTHAVAAAKPSATPVLPPARYVAPTFAPLQTAVTQHRVACAVAKSAEPSIAKVTAEIKSKNTFLGAFGATVAEKFISNSKGTGASQSTRVDQRTSVAPQPSPAPLAPSLKDLVALATQATSANQSLCVAAADEEKDKKIQNLLQQEKVWAALNEIKERPITAYYCSTCARFYRFPSRFCSENGHLLNPQETVEKWYTCFNCKYHMDHVGPQVPLNHPCPRCGCSYWDEATAAPPLKMYDSLGLNHAMEYDGTELEIVETRRLAAEQEANEL